MKVLWFEVTEPTNYRNKGVILGGWQDSLEDIVKTCSNIELYVAFNGGKEGKEKKIDGVTYVPIGYRLTTVEKIRSLISCDIVSIKLIKEANKVIKKINPDVIHVFGLEWPWGLIAENTQIPVVIHIMGSIIPYWNAFYPPNYSLGTIYSGLFPNIKKMVGCFIQNYYYKTLIRQEIKIWNSVNYYMGRTSWDYCLTKVQNSKSKYWHVDEAIRPIFIDKENVWSYNDRAELQLFSIGCASFWKGPDMLLKTAKILKANGVRFKWKIAGNMNSYVKGTVEAKERTLFSDNNIEILGFKNPEDLVKLLCDCTLYVHTAHIENSPNSICEAQCLGVPIISTNVGGISTLVRQNIDGILVPANDPYQMAANIIELSRDKERLLLFSQNGRGMAHARHNPNAIMNQLYACYNAIINQ